MTSSTSAYASMLPVCGFLVALVPLTSAGLTIINAGLGRARGAAHAMVSSLAALAVAALAYCLFGSSWEGCAGGPARLILLGGKPWDWIANEPLFMRGLTLNDSPATMAILLQVFTVGTAALIPISTGADRWRLRSICISTALLAGCCYPLFAHWVWGGGWLAQLGSNFNLGHGFLDSGGASTIQVIGGLSGLAIAWTLGPRRGKYTADGTSAVKPGHNLVYVLFGCAIALPGWIALNSAGAILFADAPLNIALIAANTMLSASASCLACIVTTRFRFGKPDASLSANGWLGGLVASSAVSCYVSPVGAISVGVIAGLLVTISVEVLEVFLMVDDPGGAISVHAVAGIWGLLAIGIFPRISDASDSIRAGSPAYSGQLLAQVLGVATLVGLMLPLIYALNLLLNRIDPQHSEHGAGRLGMDLVELGGSAYPEFAIHSDE